MLGTTNRKIKILGAVWLGVGGIFLALAFVAFLSVVIGDDPAGQAFEAGDKWCIVVLVLLGIGAILMVPGLALLRRNPVARPLLAITSLVLLVPSVLAVFPLLVVLPSLWVTLSTGGKEAFESYTPRENG